MKIKNNLLVHVVILFLLIPIAFMGCSGGGGSSSPPPAPKLTVLPANSYDFGTVTDSNTVEPLEVTLRNDGTANLVVSNIALSGTGVSQFRLDTGVGKDPCGSTPTIASGDSCTVTVYFEPLILDTFLSGLTIESNDSGTPYNLELIGTAEDIKEVEVTINQIDACPRIVGGEVTAYVSVTDQGGFPLTGLNVGNFTLSENGGLPANPLTVNFVKDIASISIVLLMDYSFSLTQEPDNLTDMEDAAKSFVGQLRAGDEAEIIKFATETVVTQTFTSDVSLLTEAIEKPLTDEDLGGGETRLYDSLIQAVDDISTRTTVRQAIIIITDGEDDDGTGNPLSDANLDDVIADANLKGIPVFTIGLGDRLDPVVLQSLADETGGTYSDSVTSDNLATIYQQLANLLFTNQYILTYNTALGEADTGDLTVAVNYTAIIGVVEGTDTKDILACP